MFFGTCFLLANRFIKVAFFLGGGHCHEQKMKCEDIYRCNVHIGKSDIDIISFGIAVYFFGFLHFDVT